MSAAASRRSWSAFGRVAALQSVLAFFCWGILGYWTSHRSWLLDPAQERVLAGFFVRNLPALGLLLVVILPALRIRQLVRRAGSDATLGPLLGFPRFVGTLDLSASVLVFLALAARLRVAEALPIESAKIAFFGLVSGVLFGVLSYGLLQGVIRPLLVCAIDAGAARPERAAFPLTRKIVVGFLSMALVVGGLVGQLALFRAERHAERSAGEQASEAAADLIEAAAEDAPTSEEQWGRFFARHDALRRGGTAFAQSGSTILAIAPQPPPRFDFDLIHDGRWQATRFAASTAAFPVRVGETRLIALSHPHGNVRVGVILPPDASVMRSFRTAATPVAVEIVAISLVLAFAAGREMTRPLRDLDWQTRAFGRNPQELSPEIAPTDDEIGVLVHSTVVMRAEIRSIQAKLRETERRAATAELLAGVAHEVRNPLFGITSAAAALERVLSGDPKIAPHLGLIARESRRLSRMMEDMLSLQRVPPRSVGPLPAAAVLRAAGAAVRARHPLREIPIEIESPENVLLADADRDRVESVFANLFENAVFSSVDVRILCRIARDDGFASITVEDDGPGVSPEVRERVFEPFVTTRAGGTGLGLAICRQIVVEHGGSIDVESEPGRTVFTVRLPAV